MSHVFSFLQDSARAFPEKVFVTDKGKEYTYSDIYRRTLLLAGLLFQSGVQAGDRILIYLDNSAGYIIAYFAVMLLNAIAVPINKNLTAETVRHIAVETEPLRIVTNSIFKKRLDKELAEFAERFLIDLDKLPGETQLAGPGLTGRLSTDDELPALILYTSGTTKMPKGVTLTHKNLTANTEAIIAYLGLTEKDSLVAVVDFSYSYGNSILLTHTKTGGSIIIENRSAYPIKVVEQLMASRASGFSTVGSYLSVLLKQGALRPQHLKRLRYITFAGESTSSEDLKKLQDMARHIKIFTMYGQTEATARLSYLEPDLLFEKAGSVGKGIPGVVLRVVTKDGKDVLPGEIGEIIASGDSIMKGYWNNEAATKQVIKDGWLHTGDLAVTDADGYIYIKGRKDDIIKHLGHRISPLEIEAVINCCDGVLESAVIGVPVQTQTQIKAFVVPKNSALSVAALDTHAKKLLPGFKRPQQYVFIDRLPRTSSGKIKRSDLKNRSIQK